MISRTHSVFYKLHLFFFLAIIVLLLLFVTALGEQERQRMHIFAHRSMELVNALKASVDHSCEEQTRLLGNAGFIEIDGITADAKKLDLPPRLQEKLKQNEIAITIYQDDDGIVYALIKEHCTMFYRDTAEGETYYFVWILFFALMGGLISMYVLLLRNLKPLKALYESIRHYGEGQDICIKHSNGKDEIALISNALSDALERQNRLKKSRELFLRNMMHELKTPITKGKLIVELEEESSNMTLLGKLFSRMEHLINQMAQVEKMHAFSLNLQTSPIDTMVETAIDNLLLDKDQIHLQGCQREIHVDVTLFTSALQNLIDNAYRHATSYPITIRCDEKSLCVSNAGEPLKRPVEEALQAFVTERGEGGLGLGLYIAQSVCDLHRFKLQYNYDEGIHHFCIRFN